MLYKAERLAFGEDRNKFTGPFEEVLLARAYEAICLHFGKDADQPTLRKWAARLWRSQRYRSYLDITKDLSEESLLKMFTTLKSRGTGFASERIALLDSGETFQDPKRELLMISDYMEAVYNGRFDVEDPDVNIARYRANHSMQGYLSNYELLKPDVLREMKNRIVKELISGTKTSPEPVEEGEDDDDDEEDEEDDDEEDQEEDNEKESENVPEIPKSVQEKEKEVQDEDSEDDGWEDLEDPEDEPFPSDFDTDHDYDSDDYNDSCTELEQFPRSSTAPYAREKELNEISCYVNFRASEVAEQLKALRDVELAIKQAEEDQRTKRAPRHESTRRSRSTSVQTDTTKTTSTQTPPVIQQAHNTDLTERIRQLERQLAIKEKEMESKDREHAIELQIRDKQWEMKFKEKEVEHLRLEMEMHELEKNAVQLKTQCEISSLCGGDVLKTLSITEGTPRSKRPRTR